MGHNGEQYVVNRGKEDGNDVSSVAKLRIPTLRSAGLIETVRRWPGGTIGMARLHPDVIDYPMGYKLRYF